MTRRGTLWTGTDRIGTLYFVALLREELGRRIQAARREAGLSQQDLAEAIGLKHAQDVSRYERGKVEVPSFRIDRIAEATGKPRSYFTRDPSEPEPMLPQPASPQEIRALQEGLADVQSQVSEILQILRRLPEA